MLDTSVAPWPCFTSEEAKAVADVICSNRVNYWTGTQARSFESEFAAWAGSAKAVAVTNGTVALDLALEALGVSAGDEIIVTPRTFIASVSSVVNAGAVPVFADVDPDSGNITPESARKVLTSRTRGIICVHLGGWPCDMHGFLALARSENLFIIEDCAQAHGARIGDRMVGTFGDVGAWSFCQDKIMTTGGEGGMVTTENPELWSKMWSYKDHGKSWDSVYSTDHAAGFRWVHDSFGTNWRMLEVQAAIGRIQLKRIGEWSERRRANAEALAASLGGFSEAVRVPRPRADIVHGHYRLYAHIRPAGLRSGWERDRIIREIQALGIPAFHGSCSEVYLEKAFDGTEWRPRKRLPVARELGETSMMFLTHPTLTADDIARTKGAIERVLAAASR